MKLLKLPDNGEGEKCQAKTLLLTFVFWARLFSFKKKMLVQVEMCLISSCSLNINTVYFQTKFDFFFFWSGCINVSMSKLLFFIKQKIIGIFSFIKKKVETPWNSS